MATRSENGKRNTRKHIYTMEYKLKVLELLKENDGNMLKTAKDQGLSCNTVKNWKVQFGDKKQEAERLEQVTQQVAEKIVDNQVEILKKIHDNKILILNRMAELIPKEPNLDNLSKCLKIHSDIDGTIKNPTPVDGPVNTNITLIESLTQNFKDYESKTPITIVGDPEE